MPCNSTFHRLVLSRFVFCCDNVEASVSVSTEVHVPFNFRQRKISGCLSADWNTGIAI